MAARQDQGLMITLIVFVILFIISFVVAYIGWKSWGDAQQQLAEAQNQKRDADTAVRNKTDENQRLLQMMGFGSIDNPDDVKKTFDEDMKRFAPNFAENQQSYRNILEYVAKENEAISARETSAKDDLKESRERMLALEAEKEKQVQQYNGQMMKAEEDAATERNSFRRYREELEATKRQLQDRLDQSQARHEGEIAQLTTQIRDLTDRLAKSERAKENLIAIQSKEAGSFEVADGRIALVNQDGTTWINLGTGDSLRRQITFGVYDANRRDPAGSERKGSIEVTRILGEHLAEARITEDDPRNPILTGDQIYSNVWHRGKKLRFSVTGFIDLDGDSRSDMKLVRDLIELNGGEVDSYLADDGTVEGEITVNTRYLVLGEFPEDAIHANLQRGWQKMSEDARTNGVEPISLDKFLNQIGYAPDDRVVTLGAGARAADFPPQPEAGGSRNEAGTFRPRSPSRSTAPTPY